MQLFPLLGRISTRGTVDVAFHPRVYHVVHVVQGWGTHQKRRSARIETTANSSVTKLAQAHRRLSGAEFAPELLEESNPKFLCTLWVTLVDERQVTRRASRLRAVTSVSGNP